VSEHRFGLGFDSHPGEVGKPLFLGGVYFEGEAGLAGHSDGDAVCHAVADALLGAASLGDIGEHFPDDDPSTAGIVGRELLGRAVALTVTAGLLPWSCDVTIIADRPKFAGRRDEMRHAIAEVLEVPIERVSVKATRPEGLGLVGDGAACIALAVLTRS